MKVPVVVAEVFQVVKAHANHLFGFVAPKRVVEAEVICGLRDLNTINRPATLEAKRHVDLMRFGVQVRHPQAGSLELLLGDSLALH
jgi:hypothetical protein